MRGSAARLEQAYLSAYTFDLSVASAQACLSVAASGMMALTGIEMAFVMVQFSAIAYSPRLVLWFARDRVLCRSLGAFAATFIYARFTLAWIDRGATGPVPLFSTLLVAIMLIYSMLLVARLVQYSGDPRMIAALNTDVLVRQGRRSGWLRQISQKVAEASEEGGFLGIGGVPVSEMEKATLTEISSALRLAA